MKSLGFLRGQAGSLSDGRTAREISLVFALRHCPGARDHRCGLRRDAVLASAGGVGRDDDRDGDDGGDAGDGDDADDGDDGDGGSDAGDAGDAGARDANAASSKRSSCRGSW
jgi:hypothetical protein